MKKILLVLAFLVAALMIAIALQPSTFNVTRTSAPIKAPPAQVYAQIEDFHRWSKWAPWFKIDPAMQQTFAGSASGKGAVYEWKSTDDNVGQGRMEITHAVPARKLDIKLDFLAPMKAENMSQFTVTPTADGGSQVEWSMSGKADFMTKGMTLFGLMDRMVGQDFEKGLADLKALAESGSAIEVKQ